MSQANQSTTRRLLGECRELELHRYMEMVQAKDAGESTILTRVQRHSQTPTSPHTHHALYLSRVLSWSTSTEEGCRMQDGRLSPHFPDHASGTLEVSINEQLLVPACLFSDVIKHGFLHVVSDKW